MLFNSFQFIWLFPLIFIAYYAVNQWIKLPPPASRKLSNALLIVISYGLYMQWKPAYAILLLGVTAVTYLSALFIEKHRAYQKRGLIAGFATLALLPLLIFKYYNFLNDSISGLFANLGFSAHLPGLNWAIPLGISFFTFQAVGYLFDVYYERIKAEHNWWDYMLFVSFFPQILSGPISKAKDLLPQIKGERTFNHSQAVEGCKMLLWGMFLKVVMADRLGLYVDTIFDNWQYNTGTSCLVASFAYTFQIYGDFAGYSLMAVGTGKLLGFDLINNFNRPYFSVSITDFWRRWHISLSNWLRDYVYIPLGGSRCSKVRNYWNIFVTFLVSGIWHGANWTFIVWGVLHGLVQIVEKALGLQKCENKKLLVRLPRVILTFLIVNFLWTIFRAPTLGDGTGMIVKMFTDVGKVFSPGKEYALYSLTSIVIVMISEFLQEFYPSRFSLLNSKRTVLRWSTYVILIVMIMLIGVFDSSQFIYVSF